MKPYEFQLEGIEFLRTRRNALLALDMGLGKTMVAILAIREISTTNTLVICPASVKYNWKKEIDKWWPGRSVHIVEGRSKKEIPQADFVIINYDLLISKLVLMQLIKRKWGVLVLDELHYLKNNAAKRTKAVYYPKGIASCADRVWGLTGTPVLNRPIELFSHLKALCPERLAPKYLSRYDFAQQFCDARETKWGRDESGASNLEELSQILEGFMLRRLKKDVLKELPDKTYQTIYLKSKRTDTAKERKAYERSKESILGELASLRRENGIKKIPQIVEHVKNILEEKRKLVVFCYHRDVIRGLREKLAEYNPAVIEGATISRKRQDEVDKFRTDNKTRVFIGQIQAAGVGTDGLQDVCDTVVFAELHYVPGSLHQAIDRCHRIGQNNPVLVQFLVAEGSIDEDIAQTVARKEKIIAQIVKKTEIYTGLVGALSRVARILERWLG
uniref:Putative helicase n=1 Tax=viral metagenome TaxID=1070528 RepID=A0A6M3M5E4_9ZZZZ